MSADKYLALTGGVGGAKLGLGLSHLLDAEQLVFLVNTGDDFEHLGFHVSPDLDTLSYTLSGLSNPELGWGREGETWHFIEALEALGGDTWFRLGDADLAMHVMRSQWLRQGVSLTDVVARLTQAMGIAHRILPMSDDAVRTQVHTADGPLSFQHYFVRERCEPQVTGFDFAGVGEAQLNAALEPLLADPSLKGVVICPSNPFVSVDPMLALPGMRDKLQQCHAPIIAVSPIVAGAALKGPTAKMMHELNIPASAAAVAAHYGDLLDGFILDQSDVASVARIEETGIKAIAAQTVMVTLADRIDLAQTSIDFIQSLNS